MDGGAEFQLGTLEETPTIGLTDYSRRVTDDFGVTKVVPRAFARRMSVKLLVPTDGVDELQRRVADLRATAARWVADDRFAWLDFRGFYKDFSVDLALPPVSYCTLTIEGLAASEPFNDPGTDPAPEGGVSTLRLLQPASIQGPALIASTVVEDDYPEWAAGTAYPLGARVIKQATHRIYESAAPSQGSDPTGASGMWTDIGPTNRWAMFDEALGSATTAAGPVEVEVQNGEINAIALLDVTADTVRVRIGSYYDRTIAPGEGGSALFLDLPATTDSAVVTIVGTGQVSIGTLMIGKLIGLGLTEAAPSAGITDFSRKEVDDFGEVTIVKRAWSKRMSAKALIDTDAIDIVAGRIAAVRARPALWIADDALDALAVYGFFKDFSIEVGQSVSNLTLSVEGLSTAGKVEPIGTIVNWPDIADPDGTKPEDNATVGAPPGTPVGEGTADNVIEALKKLGSTTSAADIVEGVQSLVDQHRNNLLASYAAQLLGEERKARWERLLHLDGIEVTTRVRQEINERVEQGEAFVQLITEIEAAATDGINAAMAAIELEQTVRASADAAETMSRELAISLFHTEVDGHVSDLQAAISSEATTRADADSAETSQRELAISTLRTEVDGKLLTTQAAISSEATTRAEADLAETAQRNLGLSALQGVVDGHVSDLEAAIATEATTRADAVSAEAALREALSASLSSDIADVDAAVLNEASARVSGDEAEATARQALAATLASDIADVSAMVLAEEIARADEDGALATQLLSLETSFNGQTAELAVLAESIDGVLLRYGVKLDSNGHVIGFLANNDGVEGGFDFVADYFRIFDADGNGGQPVFAVEDGVVKMHDVEVDTLKVGAMDYEFLLKQDMSADQGSQELPGGVVMKWGKFRGAINDEVQLSVVFDDPFPNECQSFVPVPYLTVFNNNRDLWLQVVGAKTKFGATVGTQAATSNSQHLDGFDWLAFGR